MKVTVKTLSQYSFKIDIDPDKTVKQFKEQIEKEQGKDYPCGSQKLIYSGKILADDKKVAEYDIDEKKFVVLMVTRPVPPPKKLTATSEEKTTTTTPSSSNDPLTTTTTSKLEDASGKSKDSHSHTSSSKSTSSVSSSATNSTTPTSSGPTTGQINTATNTTTTSSTTRASSAATANRTSREQSGADVGSTRPAGSDTTPPHLAALSSMQNFRQMQNLIQQSPHLLSPAIEALASSDPELYNFISENPDMFVSALNHPVTQQLAGQSMIGSDGPMSRQMGGQVDPSGRQPPSVEQFVEGVTEHDKEAIERLKELGFSEYLAIQAYMACDRDEQLAANLLFQMDQ